MKGEFNKNLIMPEKKEYLFQQSNNFGFVERLLIMKMKKLEIIVTLLVNLGVVLIGTVILTFN